MKLKNALVQLAESCRYAAETRSGWDFAVEIRDLLGLGLSKSDLRWLLNQGFIEQACESTRAQDRSRSFRPQPLGFLTRRTCFMLTASGLAFAASVWGTNIGRAIVEPPAIGNFRGQSQLFCVEPRIADERQQGRVCGSAAASADSCQPRWCANSRSLFIGWQIVKRYCRPSENQEAILVAFQEEGWPLRIDDPLPPNRKMDSKRRLNKTIQSLNACHENHLMVFQGDGTGEGIRWQVVAGNCGASLPDLPALARAG